MSFSRKAFLDWHPEVLHRLPFSRDSQSPFSSSFLYQDTSDICSWQWVQTEAFACWPLLYLAHQHSWCGQWWHAVPPRFSQLNCHTWYPCFARILFQLLPDHVTKSAAVWKCPTGGQPYDGWPRCQNLSKRSLKLNALNSFVIFSMSSWNCSNRSLMVSLSAGLMRLACTRSL